MRALRLQNYFHVMQALSLRFNVWPLINLVFPSWTVWCDNMRNHCITQYEDAETSPSAESIWEITSNLMAKCVPDENRQDSRYSISGDWTYLWSAPERSGDSRRSQDEESGLRRRWSILLSCPDQDIIITTIRVPSRVVSDLVPR